MVSIVPVLLICAMQLGNLLVSAATADETVTVEDCPADSLSTTKDQKKYYCKDTPSFSVGTDAAIAPSTSFTKLNGEYTVSSLGTSLTLDAVPQCPMELTGTVTCDGLVISVGSGADQDDGVPFKVGGNGAAGMVTWNCEDSTTGSPKAMHYHFLVSFNGAADYATASVGELAGPAGSFSSFAPNEFHKFAGVDAETTVYFVQTSAGGHTIFVSDETTIQFANGQYGTLTGGGDTSGYAKTPNEDCDKGVKICYTEDCDSASKLSVGLFLTFIPFIFTKLN